MLKIQCTEILLIIIQNDYSKLSSSFQIYTKSTQWSSLKGHHFAIEESLPSGQCLAE